MAKPCAKMGDKVVGVDTHVILVPSPGGPVPTPTPCPFSGTVTSGVSSTVLIDGQGAAVVGSVADNLPPHIPMGGPFQTPPSNKGTVARGSESVLIEDKGVARAGDTVTCCNDPQDQDTGSVIAVGTVLAG